MQIGVTDAQGNTTRVKFDVVDVDEFLDLLLYQGKITIEQHNAYGDSQSLELSLKDAKEAAEFFDWTYATDDALSIGIDKNDVDYIRDELLPLFTGGN